MAPRLAERSASPARVRAIAPSGAAVSSAVTTTVTAVTNNATVPSRLTSPRRGIEAGAHTLAAAIACAATSPPETAPDDRQQQRLRGELARELQPRRANARSAATTRRAARWLGRARATRDSRAPSPARRSPRRAAGASTGDESPTSASCSGTTRTASLRAYSTGNCCRSERQIAVSSACACVASASGIQSAEDPQRSSPSSERAAADRDRARAA